MVLFSRKPYDYGRSLTSLNTEALSYFLIMCVFARVCVDVGASQRGVCVYTSIMFINRVGG